jgi:hypothetical protein
MRGCYGYNLVYVENLRGRVVLGLPSHIVVQLEGLGGVRSLRFWICIHLAHGKISDAVSYELGDGSELH